MGEGRVVESDQVVSVLAKVEVLMAGWITLVVGSKICTESDAVDWIGEVVGECKETSDEEETTTWLAGAFRGCRRKWEVMVVCFKDEVWVEELELCDGGGEEERFIESRAVENASLAEQ